MRKILALTLTAVLCAALVFVGAGCSKPDSVAGRWTVINLYDASSNDAAGTDVENTFGDVVVYEFEDGGKLLASVAEQTSEGTWTQDGDKVSIMLDGISGEGEVVEDTMTLEYGDATMELERS